MKVQLRFHIDKSTWKAPLTVEFDARDSALHESNGEVYPCKNGPCSYTWQVYKGSQKIGKPTKNSTGTFEYTFGKKGTYLVTVYVCRGHESSDCGSSSTTVEVK
jgi:plastocyanin